MTNTKLEYVKLYRISLADIVALAQRMPTAFKIFMFLVENCRPNINEITFKNVHLAACLGIGKDQVSKALKYLIDHKFIRKNTFLEISYSINTHFMSKGAENYKQGYYEVVSYASEPEVDSFYMKSNWVVKERQKLTPQGVFAVSEILTSKE